MRLNTHEVSNVLKRGRRVRPPALVADGRTVSTTPSAILYVEARIVSRTQEATPLIVETVTRAASSGARLAVAVPKRLLKRAVDRNLVKRWMREALRQHPTRMISMDVLLTLAAKVNLKLAGEKTRVRRQINDLLVSVDDISRKPKTASRN